MDGSMFLQFLYNRLETSRRSFYSVKSDEHIKILNPVDSEAIRTIRAIYIDKNKNKKLRKIMMQSIVDKMIGIGDV